METKDMSFGGFNYKIAFDPSDHASHWTFEDEDSVRQAFWKIQPGDMIWDIGCGYGSYSLIGLAMGALSVVAWTPIQNEIKLFRESAKLNNFDFVSIYDDCLFDKEGYLNPDTQAFSTESGDGFFKTRTFDSYGFHKNKNYANRSHWFKLDVEGAELAILQGAVKFLKKFKPKILVENHEFKIAGIGNQVNEFLTQKFGYDHIQTIPYHSVTHSLYQPKF